MVALSDTIPQQSAMMIETTRALLTHIAVTSTRWTPHATDATPLFLESEFRLTIQYTIQMIVVASGFRCGATSRFTSELTRRVDRFVRTSGDEKRACIFRARENLSGLRVCRKRVTAVARVRAAQSHSND